MAARKKSTESTGGSGIYLCHACGTFIERKAEDGKPLKKWRKSYCEKTGKNARIWLKLENNNPNADVEPPRERKANGTH